MKVTLFPTCLGDQLHPGVARSVVRVLERLGCRVESPDAQVCCGQPAYNSGYLPEARRVATALLRALANADYVVTPSGSCAGMIGHHFGALFADDPKLAQEAEGLSKRLYEFSRFLVDVLRVERLEASFPERVTYHPSCHGTRLLGLREEPLRLLAAIPDLELVPLPGAQDCCGFGGTFALKLSQISTAIADEKIDHVLQTGARYLVGTDLGCLMHLAGRMERRGIRGEALHIAEVVDRAQLNVTRRPAGGADLLAPGSFPRGELGQP